MASCQVYITGLGVISAAGTGTLQTLESFAAEPIAPRPVTQLETDVVSPAFAVSFPAPPPAFQDCPSRTAELLCTAVEEALQDAGNPQHNKELRIGVSIGTTVASQLNSLRFYRDYRQTQAPDLQPVANFLRGNLSEFIAARYDLTGPRTTVVKACSSGTDAIGIGSGWIRAGLCDLVIAGGADELNRVPLAGFNSLGIMSTEPCRPFDRDRDGLNLGEGAGTVVLEGTNSVKNRQRNPQLRLAGYGCACDAHHITAPHPDGVGLKQAIRAAFTQAGVGPRDIGFVNAHGTATPENDRVESRVLTKLLGNALRYYSTKGRTGHTLGAAGGVEAVFTALGLLCGWIPGTAGCENVDPDIPQAPVVDRTEVGGPAALSTSLAFGGNNAAIVMCKE